MLLSFLIEQQAKLSLMQKELVVLSELKSQCEQFLFEQKKVPSFSSLLNLNNDLSILPHYVLDTDYYPIFHKKQQELSQNEDRALEKIFALFSSPLCDRWKEVLICKGDDQFALRTGFYQDEFDIYQSILMGFQGMTLYTEGLDVYQLQYLTEIARDYSFSLFFVIHNKQELDCVLETDAPYFILSSFDKKNFSKNNTPLYHLSPFVPKTASLFAMGPTDLIKEKKELALLGFSGLIL